MRTTLSMMLVLLIAMPLVAGGAKSAVQPAATIGSVAVSVEELDQAVGAKLTRILTDQYNVRRGVLEDLIATKLLEAEAARRKVTVEELLSQEVAGKIVEPQLADIEPVYEGVRERFPGMTKDQVLAEIAGSMRNSRTQSRRNEFIKELRRAADVQVHLKPPRVAVKAEGPSRGSADAPVTIVEFSDFECSFCGRAVETLHKIEKTYGDKVRIVYRDYPLPSHRNAKRAAEVSHCANEQGKFWEMHDLLFSKGGTIAENDFHRFAKQAGLDEAAFNGCLTAGTFKDAWKVSQEEGARVGVQSTPTFFVNGRLIVGAASYEMFARVIEEELAHAKAQQPEAKVARR
ncbi:MAG TPA: thioredoxin domain-containing protein [Thermoanaerobaculia bacterium]|nr:thioredoxin domain-containing protein [Thermoanaerobaculia bacterium]